MKHKEKHKEESPHIKKLPYRPSVGLMILNKKLEVFVGRRVDTKADAWQMPQGGIDTHESPEKAALREMKEEIGTNNAEILAVTKQWYKYDLPEFLVPKLWKGQYRGQRQKWFLLSFKGEDQEINLNSSEVEFGDWKWVKIEELPNIIVTFKRSLYISVIEEFRDEIIKLKQNLIL